MKRLGSWCVREAAILKEKKQKNDAGVAQTSAFCRHRGCLVDEQDAFADCSFSRHDVNVRGCGLGKRESLAHDRSDHTGFDRCVDCSVYFLLLGLKNEHIHEKKG